MPEPKSATRSRTSPDSSHARVREPSPPQAENAIAAPGPGFDGALFGSQVTAPQFLQLQRSVGNAAARRLMQPDSWIGSPGTVHDGPGLQRMGESRATSVGAAHAAHGTGLIQRHGSWEHRMLGDTDPRTLAMMGAARDMKTSGALIVGNDDDGYQTINRTHVQHALEQEIRRIAAFQSSPPPVPEGFRPGRDVVLPKPISDPTWQIRIVSLPSVNADGSPQLDEKGQPVKPEVVTYGELNTLADFYGSVDELKQTDHKNRHGIVQGVRQESLQKLVKLYTEFMDIKGTWRTSAETETKKKLGLKSLEFEGAANVGSVSAELQHMGYLPGGGKKKALSGDKTTAYASTLVRNACHFAPESWHAWADHHNKAVGLAISAHGKSEAAKGFRQQAKDDPKSSDGYNGLAIQADKESDSLANEALLTNGFGDHYLQDSYAGGHLINKTQIMQWYVKWIDDNPWKMDFSRDKYWRHMEQIAKQGGLTESGQYDKARVGTTRTVRGQEGVTSAHNPQTVENIQSDDWRVRFEAAGLKIPTSLEPGGPGFGFITWWQGLAGETPKLRTRTYKQLKDSAPPTVGNFDAALTLLVNEGVVRVEGADIGEQSSITRIAKHTYVLRDDYVPKDMEKFREATAGGGQDPAANDKYKGMAAAVTYKDYFMFMKNGFLQASTNVLHDEFCSNGLEVNSDGGDFVYRVYGDDAMLKKGSSTGVEHSARTANMSRNSIEAAVRTGAPDNTTAQIVARFPSHVKPPGGGAVISLADWHSGGALEKWVRDNIFPNVPFKKKTVPGVMGDLGSQMSKDEPAVHSGAAF